MENFVREILTSIARDIKKPPESVEPFIKMLKISKNLIGKILFSK